MTSDLTTARELATHAADIKHLQDDMDQMKADMAAIRQSLAEIQKTLAEARGGWKILMMLGGGAGAVGAAIVQLFHSLPGGK